MTLGRKFSQEVAKERIASGLTQMQLAEAVGVSERWIQRIEKGRIPGGEVALCLMIYLNIKPERFWKDVENVPVPSGERARV